MERIRKKLKSLWFVFPVFILIGLVSMPKSQAELRFNFAGSVDGFVARGAATVRWSGDEGGRLYMDTSGSDPGMVRSVSMNASAHNMLEVYCWTYCPNQRLELFFKRSDSSSVFSGGSVTMNKGSAGGTYTIDLSGNSNWTGTITEIRIDPADSCGDTINKGFIAFDWIRFYQKNGSIAGGVRDNDSSSLISNAMVRLEQSGSIKYTTYSNSTGNYTVNNVVPGTYNLVAIKENYSNFIMEVTITSLAKNQNIAMFSSVGKVSGGVRNENTNVALSDVLVRLEQGGSIKYTAYSNNTGNFEFTNVPPGSYTLVGIKSGFNNLAISITVTARQITSQNMKMVPEVEEVIGKPGTPTGKLNPGLNATTRYTTTGTSSNLGHDLEYMFDWGDGTNSSWSANLYVDKTWTVGGTFSVKVYTRCKSHTSKTNVSDVVSMKPGGLNIVPVVAITSHTSGSSVNATQIILAGTANDPDDLNGVKSVRIRVNGGTWQTVGGTFNWSTNITLTTRLNTIEAYSIDSSDDQSNITTIQLTCTVISSPAISINHSLIKIYQPQVKDIVKEVCTNDFNVDWSIYDTPAKDQDIYGSCWAFSTTAMIENYGNRYNLPVRQNLSEQTLVSCADKDIGDEGGFQTDALQYILDNGIDDEENFPYKASRLDCNLRGSSPSFTERILGYYSLWGETISCGSGKEPAQCLKDELFYGPIVVWMKVENNGKFRFEGYNKTSAIYHNTDLLLSGSSGWHLVLLVGYSESQQCFKAKNSWGPEWGENRCSGLTGSRGYFRIGYECVKSGVEFGATAAGIHRNKFGNLLSGQLVYIQDNYDNFTITNNGSGILTVSGIIANVPWLSLGRSSASLAAGQSVTVSLAVNNWDAVASEAKIIINSNDPNKPTTEIKISAYSSDDYQIASTGTGGGFYEPGNIYAAPSSSSQINLSWDKGLNYGVDNLEYVVMRSKSSDLTTARFVATTTGTDFQDINLESGTTYYYWVGSFVEMFKPEFGPHVTATTLGTPPSGGGGSSGGGTTPECLKPRKVTGLRMK